jgi:hypothetical protein
MALRWRLTLANAMLSRLPTRATDYCPPRLRDLFDTGRIFLQLLSVAEFNLEHVLDVFS